MLRAMARWTFTVTGCGTSHGNPMWGVPAMWSDDPRDRRRRSGGLLRADDGRVVLIDCGPDLAHQLTDPYRDWTGDPTRSAASRAATACC
jgi:phosphoribosyl 1,2-cyclic phosphodiesterase